jgi:hypothetical protein
MKTLFLTLIAFVVLFFIGCQENSLTDPLLTESANQIQRTGTYDYGYIKLEGMLNDPYPIGNSHYIISGQIVYEYNSMAPMEKITPPPTNYISLNLAINADLKYFCSVCNPSPEDELVGFITEESEENVSLTGHFITTLEKSFVIQGREDGMVLKCRFFVTTGGMELNAMWLALPDQNAIATY